MATDNEANHILAELRAMVRQAEQAGVTVCIVQRPGENVVWIGLRDCHLTRAGALEFDAAAALAGEVAGAQ
jgi:hypothetical protein